MAYNKSNSSLKLNPYIDTYWKFDNLANRTIKSLIIPDGCVDIVFSWKQGNNKNLAILAVGEMTYAKNIAIASQQNFRGIRFKPGAAAAFLKMPMNEITNQMIDLENISNKLFKELQIIWKKSLESKKQAKNISEILMANFSEVYIDPVVNYMVDKIIQTQGQIELANIITKTGYSERQIQRKFKNIVGISPKVFIRIIRFKNIYQRLKGNKDNYARLAVTAGYFDQAHFNHEYKKFIGTSPSANYRS